MVAALMLKVYTVGAAYIQATEGVASTHINPGLGLKEKKIISGRGEGRTSEEAKA